LVKRVGLIMILLALYLGLACDEKNNPADSEETTEGLNLLGLVNNRTLNYFQIDTVTLIPSFDIEIDSSNFTIRISGAGNNWVIKDHEQPLINMLVSNNYILQNGFWRDINGTDTLFYFPLPSVVMMRSFQTNTYWDDITPRLTTDTGDIRYPFYNCYFGFYYEKAYVGTKALTLTPGEFTAYRFDVNLYLNQTDSLPVATASEYYSPSVGLVKIIFNGQGLKRNIYLISYQ